MMKTHRLTYALLTVLLAAVGCTAGPAVPEQSESSLGGRPPERATAPHEIPGVEIESHDHVPPMIDTRGNLTRAIRQTKRQQDLQKERYRQESLALMNRLIFTQDLIGAVTEDLLAVQAQLDVLLAVPPAQNFAAIEKYSQDYRTLVQQQFQLKRELSELNTLFWFVDEFAWNKHSLVTPNT